MTARPKVGVAFEGGGALGLAHIGVLQWFEEHRIPVDYIAGTSMGGLVGGIYATGLRASELKELVSGIDWTDVLSGRPDYRDLAYRRKEDMRAFQNYLDFGWNKGPAAPGGLNNGQEISYLFDRIALPYGEGKFDSLPIPFRCVATDLTTGEAHVFEDGSLGLALRSTMSLPLVFSPVKQDGKIYADGGLLNNLPVDVVRRMGADVVIAVYLAGAPYNIQTSQSLFSVTGRSIGVMIAANEVHNMETADLLITADTAKFTASSYTEEEAIVKKGYEGAAKKAAMLTPLALEETAWNEHLRQRDARRLKIMAPPQFITVDGMKGGGAKEIQEALADHVGKDVDTKKLERDLDLLSGSRRYSSFSYRQVETDGKYGLGIHADERENAPPFVKIGFSVDGADYNNVLFSLLGRITVMDKGGYRSEWRTDVSLGSTWLLASELYRPLGPVTRWFVAPRVYAVNTPLNLYSHSEQIADYRVRQLGADFDFGYALDRFSEVRVGYDAGYFSSALRVGAPDLPTPSGRVSDTSVRYNLDKLDSPLIPRSGEAVTLRMQWTDAFPGAPTGFPLSEAYIGLARRVSKPGSVFLQVYGGSTFGHENTGIAQFFLGGPGRLTAYGLNELRTNQYFLGKLGYIHELFRLPPLIGTRAYAIVDYELAKTYGRPPQALAIPSTSLPTDGAASLVFDTLFGPLAIGASYGDSGHKNWFFRLGKAF